MCKKVENCCFFITQNEFSVFRLSRAFELNKKNTKYLEIKKYIIQYIDYHNSKKIKSKLKGMSPAQYRIHSLLAA